MSLVQCLFHNLANHHRPHAISKFEGFYSKFQLPSGAYFIIIFCTIKKAPDPKNRNNISVTYYPSPNATDGEVWQTDLFPEDIHVDASLFKQNWSVSSCERLSRTLFEYDLQSCLNYNVDDEKMGMHFQAKSGERVPWSSSSVGGGSPESLLVYLPLPLHWHIHSLASTASFSLSLPDSAGVPAQDREGTATVHEEKNWAVSFPSAHNWVSGSSSDRTKFISVAGGRTIGMDAFLVGYRNLSKGIELDFRPPWALKVFGLSPFMSVSRDWDRRTLELDFSSVQWRLKIRAVAPRGSFFSLAAPYPDGFKDNWLAQSLRATIEVQVFTRTFLGCAWKLVDSAVFENGGLEFGGDYYPERGTDKKRN